MSSIPAPSKMTAIEGGIEAGIRWCIVRAPLWGAINGYVEVPEGHAWKGAGDGLDVSIHGGITYGDAPGWIGFDTLHSGDYWLDSPRYGQSHEWDIHWTQEMVAEEAKRLARQVAAADPTLATAVQA